MSADFRDLVHAAAPRPSTAPDIDSLWQRGKRMRTTRRWAAAVLAATLGLAVWVVAESELASSLFDTDRPEGVEPASPWVGYKAGWTELPKPPEVRAGAAYLWTGSEVLAWGGCEPRAADDCVPTSDGFAFDPVSDTWRAIPEAPIPGSQAGAVWTGQEAIFLGLAEETRLDPRVYEPETGTGGTIGTRLRGQAYDPATGAWRAIATAPISPRLGGVEVWTGSELIVWGGGGPESPDASNGAAYDPASDTWRRIPDSPTALNSASGMWTGKEMLVFGSLLDGRNIAATQTSVGAVYDPTTDRWHKMAPSELSPQATSSTWAGDRMVAWDYEVHSQEYDPATNDWSDPEEMPLDFDECYPESAEVNDVVFAFFCGRSALYDVATGDWHQIHGGPLEADVEAGAGSYKLWRFADLVSSEEVVLLAMEGITVNNGEVCYGCPGSPHAFWAYRPSG
jgi:hypothetical protein